MTTTARQRFDEFYANGTPPWVIGVPQPAVVALLDSGQITGAVLDIGCGAGEHSILLASRGHDVVGMDFAPHAVALARANAAARGVDVRFEAADALDLPAHGHYDTVLDSAVFHVFDDADRRHYARSLHGATAPGGRVHVLALSDAGRGFGPQVSEQQIRDAFGEGWVIEDLTTTTYRGVVTELHAEALGLPVGASVDEPAWLVRVARH